MPLKQVKKAEKTQVLGSVIRALVFEIRDAKALLKGIPLD